jgi:hypothetical protein
VHGLVDGVATSLKDVVVLLAEAIDEPEIADSGLLLHLANRGLLKFLVPFDAALGKFPVAGTAFQEEILPLTTRIAKEDGSRARGLYHYRVLLNRA